MGLSGFLAHVFDTRHSALEEDEKAGNQRELLLLVD